MGPIEPSYAVRRVWVRSLHEATIYALRNLIGSQGAAAALALSSLLVLIVFTRFLEPAVFGQYALVVASISIFTKLCGVNVYFYYRHRFVRLSSDDALAELSRYLMPVLAFGTGVALLVGAAQLLLPFLRWQISLVELLLWGALAVLSLRNLEVVRFYQSTGRFTFGTLALAGTKIASAAVLLLEFELRNELNAADVLFALALSQISFVAFQFAFDRPYFAIWKTARQPFEWKSLCLGLSIMAPVLFSEALMAVDRMTLAITANVVTVAHYGLASQSMFLAYSVLGGSLISYYYPRLAKGLQRSDHATLRSEVRWLLVFGALSNGAVGAAIFFAPEVILYLAGDKYAGSVPILKLLAGIPLAMFVQSILAHFYYLADRTTPSVVIYAIAFPLHVAVTVFLTTAFGVVGAAVSLYISIGLVATGHALCLPTIIRSSRGNWAR